MASADRPGSCNECGSPLEQGQRYCTACGARCSHLSLLVAGTIAALYERGRPPQPPEPESPPTRQPDEPPRPRLDWRTPLGPKLPTPRVASAAVMAFLGFGVILGSLGNVSLAQLAAAPSIILNLPSGGSANAPSGGSGGSSGGGSGSAQQQSANAGSGTMSSSAATTGGSSSAPTSGSGSTGFNGLPAINNVFVIMLSNEGYNQTFNRSSSDSYLNKTLPHEGELVTSYYGVAGSPLANEIALLSGQGPTQQTEANCRFYTTLAATGTGSHGQVLGNGCVYPASTKTLMGQLTADHKTWKAYIGGMPKACDHPSTGAADASPSSTKHPYAEWTNPFVFFKSIVGSKSCRQDDVGIGQLKTDLKSESTTPTFAYIAPSPCEDGSATPCVSGAASGLGPADKFLKTVLAEIKASPAYSKGALVAITFDEAPQTGTNADSTSCCSQPTFPNLPAPSPSTSTTPTTTTTTPTTTTTTPTTTTTTPNSTTTTPTTTTTTTPSTAPTTPPGGGQVGLLLLSKWVKPNFPDPIDQFNHFSLLKGIEQLFGLKSLGYANESGVLAWSSAVFTGKGP